jgi:Na+/proline symporter
MNLHPVDAIVLIAYLIGITFLGSWMGRKISTAADYFMRRRFGKATMIMHAFRTGTASDQAVSVAAATAKNGLSGIWFQWMWRFSTPFYWLIAPIMRRFRAVTTADVYELRYDRSVAMLFAAVGIASMAVKIGLMLKGAGALIESGTESSENFEVRHSHPVQLGRSAESCYEKRWFRCNSSWPFGSRGGAPDYGGAHRRYLVLPD